MVLVEFSLIQKPVYVINRVSLFIKQYGSLKTDLPGTPLKKGSRGWDKNALKVPLFKGDLGGSPGQK